MQEVLWTVVRFPAGNWSSGGKPTDPDYAECEVFEVLASSREQAVKKAQAKRRREQRKSRKTP